jgi:hypothetical protein
MIDVLFLGFFVMLVPVVAIWRRRVDQGSTRKEKKLSE